MGSSASSPESRTPGPAGVPRAPWESDRRSAEARGRFLAEGVSAAEVRGRIVASWERCRATGLSVERTELSYDPDLDSEERLLLASLPVLDRLHEQLAGSRVSVLLTDARARVMLRRAGEPGLNRHLDAIRLAPGFVWAEHEAGTNGIGTALAEGRPGVVVGSEHFAEAYRPSACAGAPVRDPLLGTIRGVVDLTSRQHDANPLMAALAGEAALAIEQRLLDQYSRRERAFLDAARRRTPGRAGATDRRARHRDPAAEPGVLLSGPAVSLIGGRRAGAREEAPPVGAAAAPVPREGARLLLGDGSVLGQVAVAARHRLTLLWDAGVRIGTTLDVGKTADELAEVALPEFAQYAVVDLAEWVPEGEEPPPTDEHPPLRRAATRTVRGGEPAVAVGSPVAYRPGSAQARALGSGRAVLDEDLSAGAGPAPAPSAPFSLSPGDERGPAAGRPGSVIAVPLSARGTVLGVASFYRSHEAGPFHEDDLTLAEELAHRAAVCLDNARRYTREHALALALQRSLLPRALPELPAVEVAHRYLPAQEGVGGDWFDVIPLSGARVALVVGDVVGHGIHAAATMGRLRTAVRNFSALDLPPEELLGHLDALVDAMDQEEGELGGIGIIGATCLYVIYDPVTRRCTMAGAGHPSPALVFPDGTVHFPEVPSGPPLGLGSTPFEAIELALPEGCRIVLYTDGLIEDRGQDIDVGLSRLATALAGRDRAPEALCTAVLADLLPQRPCDDVALLVARTRGVDDDLVARWEVPLEPAAVAGLRAQVAERLTGWGLTALTQTTQLLVSELVTNAILHTTGPVELRLLRDRTLICEVADGSSVSPRLRRARTEDENGRGLFLVAQLAERWGTRFTSGGGKVIWAEVKPRTGSPVPAPRA
ncbi:SpoIIE family protein phosphatase [Streptacidiphilus rugosus]|uniref:SpoIIE family protein phosphatase n=1 Tax=Streptacidiphilus rugosus TaxID=405783 RepID=UPI0009FC9D3D|nr:SpoIIE family protein phosphatase [Streptacidiphilus rugosus]